MSTEKRNILPIYSQKVLTYTLLAAIVFVSTNTEAAEQRRSPDWFSNYEPNTHKSMPYRLMKPLNFDSKKSYPVIVSLHGAGGKGNDNRKQLKGWNKELAEKKYRTDFPCYVLVPQSKELWSERQFNKIKEIITDLPSVDKNRIYILGHSMGGHGSYIFIQLDPNYFAAAAPSAGSGLKRTEEFITASVIKDIPIWAFHGDKDRVCPYERQQKLFVEMKKLGGNMKLTTFVGDNHGIAHKFITGANNGKVELSSDRCDPEPDFMKWLFKQKRPVKKPEPEK